MANEVTADKVLKVFQDGNLIRIKNVDKRLHGILFTSLSYYRRSLVRGTNGRHSTIDTQPVSCVCTQELNGVTQAITNAGFLPRLVDILGEHGYQLELRKLRKLYAEDHEPCWENIERFELRPGQREMLESVAASERGRIWWPTGGGKSFLVPLICLLFPKMNIVVTTKHMAPLLDLHDNLSTYLPSVGIYCSQKKKSGRRVMCYSSGCLQYADPQNTHMVIADELHELATDAMFERFAQFRYSKMFGLSANVDDRWDGADFELEGLFGSVIAALTYEAGVSQGSIVPIRVLLRNVFLDDNPAEGHVDIAQKRHGIWRNEARNELIAEDARAYDDEQQVLITVSTFDHACHLKKLLPDFTMVYAPTEDKEVKLDRYVKWGLLSKDEPEMTRHRLDMLKKRFEDGRLKKVIATTVWNRGVNFRNLQVLIRADGVASKIVDTQIPGRLSRTGTEGDKEYGILIDYLDQFDERLARAAKKRVADYKEKSWEIVMPEKKRIRLAE